MQLSYDNASAQTRPAEARPPRLLEQLRNVLRVKHYSIRTERAYVEWVRRFVHFTGMRHPRDCGSAQVEAFLTHLASEGQVAASTQNQARSALLFLYKEVLHSELPWLDDVESAKRPARVRVVLTQDEVDRLLQATRGTSGLVLRLLYGTGMRILECLRLRVKDVDFSRREIVVREGKGFRDRVTMLPACLCIELENHLRRVYLLHARDLAEGYGEVYLPYSLARKYPRAAREWPWQYVFPSDRLSVDPRSGTTRRHQLDPQVIQRALRDAMRTARRQARHAAHLAAFVCDAPAGFRL